MARTRKKKPALVAGRDTFHVMGLPGAEIVKAEAAHALNVAQRTAEVFKPDGPLTLTVERRSLFGPATTLYRVVRDAHDRVVRTYSIDAQD